MPSHWGLPWRGAFGQPYNMGTVSYMGVAQQATPLHYDDVENLVRLQCLANAISDGGMEVGMKDGAAGDPAAL